MFYLFHHNIRSQVDKGLEPEEDGVQLMKPIPNLDELLEKVQVQIAKQVTQLRDPISAAERLAVTLR